MNPVLRNLVPSSSFARLLTVTALALSLCFACAKRDEKGTKAAAAASASAGTGLPADVDPKLLRSLKDVATTCQIDVSRSKVACPNPGLDALTEQITQGARSQSRSLATVAFALAQADEKLMTVAAEFLNMAFRVRVDEKDRQPVSRATASSLISTVGKLPANQALHAAPAAVYAAFEAGTERELYAAIDKHPYPRLAAQAYRHLMAAGGMRGFDKVQEMVKSEQLDLASAGLDAPSLMREKTPEQRAQICDWYKSLVSDQRPVVANRASGYLIVCGPSYIEQLLTADEALLTDKTLAKFPLNQYSQMCKGIVAASGPTPDQCTRFRKLLITVAAETRFEPRTRAEAIGLLAANFADQELLTLLKRYAADKQPLISKTGSDGVESVSRALNPAQPAREPVRNSVN